MARERIDHKYKGNIIKGCLELAGGSPHHETKIARRSVNPEAEKDWEEGRGSRGAVLTDARAGL